MALDWFDAQKAGQQAVYDKEDRQRRIAQEDRDIAYNQEIRRQYLEQLRRAEEVRKARANRGGAPVGGFKYTGQGQSVGGTGGTVQTGATPTFNVDATQTVQQQYADNLKKLRADYNAKTQTAQGELGGVGKASTALQEHIANQKKAGYQQYLPDPSASASVDTRSPFAQTFTDSEAVDAIQGRVNQFAHFIRSGDGTKSGQGTTIFDTANPFVGGQGQIDSAESSELADFYEIDTIGNSAAEQWFINNPGELDKIDAAVAADTRDVSADVKLRKALADYYFNNIKPKIAANENYLTETQVDSGDKGSSTPVYTDEQIKSAQAQHLANLKTLETGAKFLTDKIKAAPAAAEKREKEKLAAEKKLAKLKEKGVTAANQAEIAKLEGIVSDMTLLDPVQASNVTNKLHQEREFLKQKVLNARRIAELSGEETDWATYDALRLDLSTKDTNLYKALGDQGINDLKYNNDPRRLSAVLSHYTNSNTIIQPRSDGMYHIISNGKLVGGVHDSKSIMETVRMYSDEAYKKQAAANAQLLTKTKIEGTLTESDKAKNESEITKSLLTEMVKGMNARDKLAMEQQFKNQEWKFNATGDGTGTGLITAADGRAVLYNPTPGVSESGVPFSPFTDVTGQLPPAAVQHIRSGTAGFNKEQFIANLFKTN